MDIKILTKDMDMYPNHLKNIAEAPELLYYIGDISLIQSPLYAIVGTRRSSPYGRWAATEISKKIASCGIPIVSGMAEGIDTCAHRGCLDVGTPTVAVLGTGIDVPFPRSNRKLYEEIAKEGLIISEYEPGFIGHQGSFPRRNRIISGLSRTVIVAEGAYKSGSMITANWALSQGRDVFAVPGNINNPNSTGVNNLIADGAGSIIDINEVLVALGITGNQMEIAIANCDEKELAILEAVKNNPGITAEELADAVYDEFSTVLSKTCHMELKGILRQESGRFFFT
ncbi:MAG: DNA-processing protein DprA [Bacillota bacterium]|nr:DNA-processing protein DprA [Bacillota bacterium]